MTQMHIPENCGLQLNIETHPDGEQELSCYGNGMINDPVLQAFLALHKIPYRKSSYRILTKTSNNWGELIPKLKAFLAGIETLYPYQFNLTVQEFPSRNSYDHDMHFIFAQEGDWLEIRMPNCVEFDTYGSDHGMYAHDIIMIADLFQQNLTQRILDKWGIEYFKLRDQALDGYRFNQKHNNLWVYEETGGFFKKFETEVQELFATFTSTQPADFTAPKVTFEQATS